MRFKRHEEDEGNSERWLVSYADFITLLFAVFSTLYAISTVDMQKMGDAVTSMRASFDNRLLDAGGRNPSVNPGIIKNPAPQEILQTKNDVALQPFMGGPIPPFSKRAVLSGEDLGRLRKRMATLLSAEMLKGRVQAHTDERGLIISLGEAGLFDSGSARIKPEGEALLVKIAAILAPLGNQVRVEGHTDNLPIKNSRFPSNWELSTGRATAMVAYLISNIGMAPELISAAGYSEYRPIATNDTEEGRSRNRRVDIVVLSPSIALAEPR